MSKAQRDAEIERICDIAVAEENRRLMTGSPGPGDKVDLSNTVEHEGDRYPYIPTPPEEQRQQYAELIETPQPLKCSCSAPYEACANCDPSLSHNGTASVAQIEHRLAEIRARVMSFPSDIRLDVGFLLTVIDAYEQGRLRRGQSVSSC